MLRPDLDFGYVSEPEPALNNRIITYNRGKGLGGSSILNFGVYLYGAKGDYERWAELVGDEEWGWNSVKDSFHAMEEYDYVGSSTDYKHLADPAYSGHGTLGKLKVGLPPVLEKGAAPHMEALKEAGEKINLDPNSGDPVGVSVFPYSYSKEGRSTSAIAHLKDSPKNLEVWTGAMVERLVFEGERVTGVEIGDGRKGEYRNLICHSRWLSEDSFGQQGGHIVRWSPRHSQAPAPERHRTKIRTRGTRYRRQGGSSRCGQTSARSCPSIHERRSRRVTKRPLQI